ncbi:glycosyltransferase [Chryseobacterium sp. MYb264]|uniref:glycosyltransferase n=1 Tax=Chryseobacterium sp. MYb264 TaxID=2745153 RepID=UPI002E0FA565|nr:glycosyltransferase [Chryseobacterium sp. MYb264]
MKILIDNSNLFAGGGLQVAASFLRDLKKLNSLHTFHVVLSINCVQVLKDDVFPDNFTFYNLGKKEEKSKRKRIKSVSQIENSVYPDCIFTIFGPSYHKSNFPKLVGFAIPYIIYPDSPFFKQISIKEKIYYKILSIIKTYSFKKNSDSLVFETENARQIFINRSGYENNSFTVGNTLNEIFSNKFKWIEYKGISSKSINILFLTANYPHKNMMIIPQIIMILKEKFTMDNFKFLITLTKEELNYPEFCDQYIEYLGKVNLESIPSLYEQSQIVFIPSLLEVFSATYLEAMFMKKPIIASDLGFSRDICGEAAYYCEPVNPDSYAKAIYELSFNEEMKHKLVNTGTKNLQRFGSSMDRTNEYMNIIKKIVKDNYDNQK